MGFKNKTALAGLVVVVLLASMAWAGVANMLVGGSDLVFRGSATNVVAMSGRGNVDSSGALTFNTKYAEMYAHEITIALTAGVWANVVGMTNGLISASGMTQNDTNGSVTVSGSFVGEFVGSASLENNEGPSEEYHLSVAVDGVDMIKCEEHRSITTQASLAAISISCLINLSDGDVVTLLANSVGGDDITLEHVSFYLKEL